MGPDGPREDIQRAIEATGCKVRPDPARGGFYSVDCPSFAARAELVSALAWRDALHDGAVRALAMGLAYPLADKRPESLARCIHRAVRDRVHYVGEAGDIIQDPIATWDFAMGDCDCHARLVLALLRSLGVECELVGFTSGRTAMRPNPAGPEIQHAVACWQRAPGEFIWLETTLPDAEFGEHPIAAAERLFADRRDLRP